jgi:hypothetical protein
MRRTALLAWLGLTLLPGQGFAGEAPAAFTEEALARGLSFTMGAYPQTQGYLGQGGGFVDLDSDGDPDVVLLGAGDGTVGIFENIGGGYFVDRSTTSGIPIMEQQEAFAAADYDADGLIDLYLTQHAKPNKLMKNLGGFSFADVSTTALVDDDGPATGASWGDFDGDGWLDLYVCNYSAFAPKNPNLLYRNNADNTFADVAHLHGVNSSALSFQSVWTDYDRDHDLDLYLSNDRGPLGFTPNQLWRNDGGVLVDVSEASGADVSLYSMGLAAGDFDGNGYPDYYVTNINTLNYNGINPLILNQTDGTFIESAEAAGVANWLTSWGSIFFDFDNNGHKDLYVNNMWVPNTFFSNDGTFPCEEIAEEVGVQSSYDPDFDLQANPPAEIVSFTSAVADVDGDGDIDLLVNNVGDRAELFINHEGTKRNHVRYNVVGEYPNLFAVGVSIETTAGGVVRFDESYAGGNGYLGQNELVLHVGLDQAPQVDQAVVRWPSGGPTRTLSGLPVNETWTIYPPSRLCDAEGDAAVGREDFEAFAGCFASDFVPGCEMMDYDGDSEIEVDDMASCFVERPADCNGNGTEDLLELLLDLDLDGDGDGALDCCAGGATPYPSAVGPTLMLGRSGSGEVELSWAASAVDGSHDAAESYDVYGSTTGPEGGFVRLANVVGPSHAEPLGSSPQVFYVVGARNGCGSSGEEPF